MTTQKPTPEEKLFAVIQGAGQGVVRARSQPLSLAHLRRTLVALFNTFDLPRINQALLAVMIGLGVLCLLAPLLAHPSVERIMARTSQQPTPFVTPPLSGLHPIEEYVQVMTQQDPFRIGERPLQSADTATPSATHPDPKTLVADLKLVGISFSDQPVAMIEEHGQTHILKVGDALGQMTVKEILKDRVLFHVGDQDVELY